MLTLKVSSSNPLNRSTLACGARRRLTIGGATGGIGLATRTLRANRTNLFSLATIFKPLAPYPKDWGTSEIDNKITFFRRQN